MAVITGPENPVVEPSTITDTDTGQPMHVRTTYVELHPDRPLGLSDSGGPDRVEVALHTFPAPGPDGGPGGTSVSIHLDEAGSRHRHTIPSRREPASSVVVLTDLDDARALRAGLDAAIAAAEGHRAEPAAMPALDREPREGHEVVVIQAVAECGLQMSTDTQAVDAAWWDSLTDAEREQECTTYAVDHLANFAGSGASEVARRPYADGDGR